MDHQTMSEKDPYYHTQKVGQMMDELINHLRDDIEKVDDPQAKALFEVSAEVMGGLLKAFHHYENRSEKAWR